MYVFHHRNIWRDEYISAVRTSHIWMSHVTDMNKLVTDEGVMPNTRLSHATHVIASQVSTYAGLYRPSNNTPTPHQKTGDWPEQDNSSLFLSQVPPYVLVIACECVWACVCMRLYADVRGTWKHILEHMHASPSPGTRCLSLSPSLVFFFLLCLTHTEVRKEDSPP